MGGFGFGNIEGVAVAFERVHRASMPHEQGGHPVHRGLGCCVMLRNGRPRLNVPKLFAMSGNGAQGRDRTADTVIFSHVLYQLSYLAGIAQTTFEQNLSLDKPNRDVKRVADGDLLRRYSG